MQDDYCVYDRDTKKVEMFGKIALLLTFLTYAYYTHTQNIFFFAFLFLCLLLKSPKFPLHCTCHVICDLTQRNLIYKFQAVFTMCMYISVLIFDLREVLM